MVTAEHKYAYDENGPFFLDGMTAGDLQSALDADTAVRTSSTSPPLAQLNRDSIPTHSCKQMAVAP